MFYAESKIGVSQSHHKVVVDGLDYFAIERKLPLRGSHFGESPLHKTRAYKFQQRGLHSISCIHASASNPTRLWA